DDGIHWVYSEINRPVVVEKLTDEFAHSLFISEQGHVYYTTPKNSGVGWIEFKYGVYVPQGSLHWCGDTPTAAQALATYFGWLVIADNPTEGGRLLVIDLNDPERAPLGTFGTFDIPPNDSCTRCGPSRPESR
ncbi:MAG: hypothetical protein HYR55_04015, partial [Acidobacteria bacterium]|nr:hypothetical protein [Acidobacteriota bacterium]